MFRGTWKKRNSTKGTSNIYYNLVMRYTIYINVLRLSVILHFSKHIFFNLRFLKHNNCIKFDSHNKSSHSKHLF